MSAPARPWLSDTQQRALEAIRDHLKQHGIPPTVRDLAVVLGRSTSTTTWNLDQLVAKGYLRRKQGVARGLVLADPVAP